MKKRVLSILMCAVMIFSSAPFTPWAELSDFALSVVATGQGLEVYFEEIEVFENAEGTLVPVATFDGVPVTEGITYRWTSSNTDVATVDSNGKVKGIREGTARITLTATYITAGGETKTFTYGAPIRVVGFREITSLEPDSSASVKMIERESTALRVRILPVDATIKELSWSSSDEGIVKVISSGVDRENSKAYASIRAMAEGQATVTYRATDGTGKTGSFTVTVSPLVKTISLPPFVVISTSTASHMIDYSVHPWNAGNQTLDWSSDNEGVCIAYDLGKITPGADRTAGTCFVTAAARDGSGTIAKTYVVVSDGTRSISLDKSSLSMKVGGGNVDLTATCVLSCGIEYKDAVRWVSSDTSVATVDSLGIVKAVGPGTAKITATTVDGSNLSSECNVSVTQPVNGVSLPENEVCWVADTLSLKATLIPANASNQLVTWSSSNEEVATVSDTGLVTGLKEGFTVITVTTADGGYNAYCRVSVENPPRSIELTVYDLVLKAGDRNDGSYVIGATVRPENATNKEVTWSSSDEKVVTVDEGGLVTAVAGGNAVITCRTKSGNVTAKCNITVTEDSTFIRITNPPTGNLYKEQTYRLQYELSSPTVTNKNIVWSSSNESVVVISQDGIITVREGSGSSVITASYYIGGKVAFTDECIVFVTDKISVESVTLNKSKQTIYTTVGANVSLFETVIPENASNKDVYWESSSKTVAEVSYDEGTVIAKSPGTAKITVTTFDGNLTDYCIIKVLSPIEFYSSTVKVPVGSSERLSLKSDNPSDTPITWMSSDEKVATVDKNGIVKGIKAGTVTITATTAGGIYSASCKVNVVIPVTGVKINADTVTIPKGESRTVTVTVSPSNATDRSVTWSTPAQTLPIIRINEAGQIEGVRVGTTTATVTTNDGRYMDVITVNVIQPVTSIDFEYSSITLDAGKKKTLSPQIKPIGATNKNVKWSSSNQKIAKVDENGVVTGVAAGTATITCTSADGYAKQTLRVTVTQPPTGIKFSSKKVTVKIGTPKKLNYTVLPENASNKNVIFTTADSSIAKVAADGTVTGVKKGTTKITVTTANSLYSATVTVNVQKPVKSVKLNKTSVNVAVGKTTVITPTVSPKSASNKNVTWKSSDNDVVTVKDGTITAKAPGYAVITCTTVDGGKTAECAVSVNQPVKSVRLNKKNVIIDIDEKLTLKATIKPSDASNKALRWTTSSKKVAKVSSKGVITPVSTGTATITVTTVDGGYKATCKVTVVKRVKSVSLPSSLTVFLGETGKLKAVLNPTKPSNPDITWSSSKKSVATVKNGVITPKKTGVTNIKVTTDDGGLTAVCKVSVKKALKSFTLNKKSVTLNTGATYSLKVKRKPSDATESVLFSTSNKNVATVNANGVITATGRGTATITAKSERGKTVKCTVTVNQPVNSMYISRTSASVYMGESLRLTANVLPGNANNQSFTWSSSDNSVITVSGGTVTPKKVGTAVITVRSANGKTATCTVTVKQHVTGITVDKKTLSLEVKGTATLKAAVSPANATEKGYTFSSSDTSVATVTAAGLITAIAPGTATITVRSKENNRTATCAVTVIKRVTGVEISTTAETLYVDKYYVGEKLFLSAEVLPADATNKNITWSSSDEGVATVDENGVVTAVKSGVALITVTTADGHKTANCSVTVLQHVSGISLEKTEVTVNRGQSIRLIATVEPADAFNKNIRWVYDNEQIATVDEYGWLTGVTPGKTTVSAITVDGEIKASCLVKVNEPVTGIELDITEVDSLYRDNTVALTPTVHPTNEYVADENINRAVTWSSSDENIARVDENGVVTATGAGEVTITATTVDGGFKASCVITCFIPVEEIVTESDIYYIKIGEEKKIDASVLPSDASFPELRWEILTGSGLFTCEDGVITGLAKGSGWVKITSIDNPDVTKEIEISVIRRVESVSLDKSEVTLNKGETSVLSATVMPSDAHNKKYSFSSSDESVVTVSEDGTVTATGRGTARVTVTTEDEGCTAECIFNVKQLVEEITFPESEYTVGVGKQINLVAAVLPENANDKTLDWQSSNSSVAVVTDGVVTGVRVGEAYITATATDKGEIASTVKVTVVRHAEKIELTAERAELWVGESAQLDSAVLPEDTTDKTVTFTSSDESIAVVDENGRVTAVSAGENGTAEVTVTARSACGSAESEYTFTVRQQITSIGIPEKEVVLKLGESYSFAPEVLPGNAFDKTVSYSSSDAGILAVEGATVTAVGTGTARITLTSACGGVTEECVFRVIVLPEAIEAEREISVEKNKTYELRPVLTPDNVTESKITYTSFAEEIATVDENGVITAHKAGTAVIIAQSEVEDVFCECIVNVYVSSESIELTADKYELYIGEEFTLGATVLPEDTTNKNVSFTSSDDNILTVDSEGRVKATGKGVATVTVTAEDTGITSLCEVTVRKHVEGIRMESEAVAYVGRPLQLTADIIPADADNQNIIWRVSDDRVAAVDSDGIFTAKEKGFVLVTGETEDGGFEAICFVEIRIGIDSVSLSKSSLLLDRGATERLSFSVLPANADDKKVIWTSSDETVATVDSKGNVTATEKSGTAVIRATAIDNPEAYAECTVTVKVPLESIFLQERSLALRKGGEAQIVVAFRPAEATVKDVTFESESSEIASVDANGLVTAHNPGEVKITVTSAEGGYTAVCTVKVYKEIDSFVSEPLVINKGTGAAALVAASPRDHDEALSYVSDNEEIATVDENGIVTALKAGTATVTVTGSISGKSESFTVTVREPVRGVEFLQENAEIFTGGYTLVRYSILSDALANADDLERIESIVFSSSDESVARIVYGSDGETDGTVQGMQSGEAEITVTVTAKSGVYTDTYTVRVIDSPSE